MGRGNYTMGVTEQIIFPEINIDKLPRISGMDMTFVTTAKTNEKLTSCFASGYAIQEHDEDGCR
jgi:ribosomal protein L5